MWIILIVVVILGGVGYAFMAGGSDSEDTNTSETSEDSESSDSESIETDQVKKVVFSDGTEVLKIDEDGEIASTGETLPPITNEWPSSRNTTNGNLKVSLEFFEELATVDDFLAGYRLVLSYVDESEPDEDLAPSNVNVPIDWLSDTTVLLQKYSCFECDGPPRAEYSTLDITNGNVEELVDFYDKTGLENFGFTNTSLTPNMKTLVVAAEPFYIGPTSVADLEASERTIFVYDIATDVHNELASLNDTSTYFDSLVGFSENGTSVIAEINKFEAMEADESGNETKISFDGIALIDLKTGAVTKKSIELSDLAGESWPGGTVTSAITLNDTLYFVTENFASMNYKLRSLDLSQDTFEVATLRTSNDPIELIRVEVETN